MKSILIMLCLHILCTRARPWNVTDFEMGFDVVQQGPSQLVKTIDSMSSSFSKALKTASPTLTPLFSMGSLAYIGYVGSVMYFPSMLTEAGLPLLEDYKFEPRTTRTMESGLIDSLATGYMKDMIGRTEAADILRNTSMTAVQKGMGALKRTTRFLNTNAGSLLETLKMITTTLSPECLSRIMCQVGQFTSLHIPAIGPVLRSINTVDLDDYSQALIDGTTIGDCSAVYFSCPL